MTLFMSSFIPLCMRNFHTTVKPFPLLLLLFFYKCVTVKFILEFEAGLKEISVLEFILFRFII